MELRTATLKDIDFLYLLHSAAMKTYVEQTWDGRKVGSRNTSGRNSILPLFRSSALMIKMSARYLWNIEMQKYSSAISRYCQSIKAEESGRESSGQFWKQQSRKRSRSPYRY